MGEREAFEWWAVDHDLFIEIDDAIRGDGRSYKFRETQTAWEAWQAARSLSPQSVRLSDEGRSILEQAFRSCEETWNPSALKTLRAVLDRLTSQPEHSKKE